MSYEEMAEKVTFQVGESSLLVKGVKFPHTRELDPLGKIWAILRRRLCEEYGVSVVGIFGYDDVQELISCTFFLDYAAVEEKGVGTKTYAGMYADSYAGMIARFEDIVEQFITSPDGLQAYEKLMRSPIVSRTTFDAMFNKFLRRIGVRTDEDDRRACRHRDLLQQVKMANRRAAASPPPPFRFLSQ